jgi:2-methylcitrate dehydratase PrpD
LHWSLNVTLLRTIADYAVAEQTAALRTDVLHAAKRAAIDWFAAMLPGSILPPASSLVAALSDDVGHGDATLFPDGLRTTARTAALINGTAAHLVEFDDIFRDAIYHPGAPVIAAALAVAQSQHASGEQLLRAIVVGYEISTRIAVALTPAHYRYWHTTGTVGTFGAAAAACTVLRLDARQVAHALATAATFAAGLQQAFRSDAMSKPLHAGRAAEGGVLAALLAARGVTGAADVLEGERGFGQAMSGSADWSKSVAELGQRYDICAVTIKNHACCGHTFAAIDGALALKARDRLQAAEIRNIEVETYQTALDVTGNFEPRTEFEAKFSLPFVVASALVHGSVRLDAFTEERLHDPDVRRLMQAFQLRADPGLNAAFPQRRAARLVIETADGVRHEFMQSTRKGDPDLPLTDDELTDKYHELATPVLGRESAKRLLAALWALDALGSVTDLAPARGAASEPRAAELVS